MSIGNSPGLGTLGDDLDIRKSIVPLGVDLDPDESDHFIRREDAERQLAEVLRDLGSLSVHEFEERYDLSAEGDER